MKYGSITTGIIADGLVFNMDAANRASYPRSGIIANNTISNATGSFSGDTNFDSTSGSGVFHFDGTDDNINFGTPIGDSLGDDYSGDVTLSFWYNINANSGIFSLGSGTNYGELHVQIVGSKISWGIDNDVWRRKTTYTLTGNIWTYAVVVYKNGSVANSKIYVNGEEPATQVFGTFPSSNMDFAGKILNIGSWWVFDYNGALGPLHIYNRALSANEVLHNYNALKGRFGL
jgi:hypothetical protein